MGTLAASRVLRRCRIPIAVGALIAVAIAALGVLGGAAQTSGFAAQRLLVDTPSSLIADSTSKGGTGAAVRAAFLGNLAASDPTRRKIAAEMFLEPAAIGIVPAGGPPPGTISPAAEKIAEVSPPRQRYLLTYAEDPGLPLITVLATAPDEAAARNLAGFGAAALDQAAREAGAATRHVAIRPIGGIASGARSSGPRKSIALGGAFCFFVAWSFAVVAVDRVRRSRRHERLTGLSEAGLAT